MADKDEVRQEFERRVGLEWCTHILNGHGEREYTNPRVQLRWQEFQLGYAAGLEKAAQPLRAWFATIAMGKLLSSTEVRGRITDIVRALSPDATTKP